MSTEFAALMVSAAALLVSVVVAVIQHRRRVRENNAAQVAAYFFRLPEKAQVILNDGAVVWVGYHLVLWNRGPGPASAVSVTMKDEHGADLELQACPADEFPLAVLDVDGRYPIPWVVAPRLDGRRRATAHLEWKDGNGNQRRTVPLRRGHVQA
ncbi:hypothetical protein [Kribbella soli]|uniref:Uncharacterized protein n=1 Tax=Kribbella soli TaxID=1124743 RepID=A0A4R0HLQ0_9ACTN|nr:hypothetical protein [Kribbella soli]TCC11188.1 hypothetical protein E0H45_07845 [Kribbella soli]